MSKQCPCRAPVFDLIGCHSPAEKTGKFICTLRGDTFRKKCTNKLHKQCYHPEAEDMEF